MGPRPITCRASTLPVVNALAERVAGEMIMDLVIEVVGQYTRGPFKIDPESSTAEQAATVVEAQSLDVDALDGFERRDGEVVYTEENVLTTVTPYPEAYDVFVDLAREYDVSYQTVLLELCAQAELDYCLYSADQSREERARHARKQLGLDGDTSDSASTATDSTTAAQEVES